MTLKEHNRKFGVNRQPDEEAIQRLGGGIERTWRQGYVPGKAKKTVHIDDEVARVLEIRAAEERVSQSEIVERALRKELGMVRKIDITVIECGEG